YEARELVDDAEVVADLDGGDDLGEPVAVEAEVGLVGAAVLLLDVGDGGGIGPDAGDAADLVEHGAGEVVDAIGRGAEGGGDAEAGPGFASGRGADADAVSGAEVLAERVA